MANEPQWTRSVEHQSSDRQTGRLPAHKLGLVTAADSMPLTTPASPTAAAGIPSTVSRRLPPPHASLDLSADAVRTSPPQHRPVPILEQPFERTSPNLTWQQADASASTSTSTSISTKRRRVQHAEHHDEGHHSAHAYSSTLSRDGRRLHAQSGHNQQPGDSLPLHDKLSGDGGHAPAHPQVADVLNPTGRRPSCESTSFPGSLTRCCSPHCSGSQCCGLRSLFADVLSEFHDLDQHLQVAIAGTLVRSSQQPPDVEQSGFHTTLGWLLDRLRWNNAGIRSLLDPKAQAAQSREGQLQGGIPPPIAISEGNTDSELPHTRVASPDTMKRRRGEGDKDAQPPRRLAPSLQPAPGPGPASFVTGPMAGPSRQLPPVTPAGDQPPPSYSPHAAFAPSQPSPLHAPQQHAPQTSRMLPSPSSFQYPNPQQPHVSTPPFGTGAPGYHEQPQTTPAQLQHLQDLQHQVTLKTLAFQTLQGEYDSLLAKLERQRTKCLTLEKKFEVSDIEINSLTEERERLQAQVTLLETQAEELTRGRDDARKEMAESGRQYIRIVEMASRLQVQSSDQRRKWDEERKELVDRIRSLELGIPDDDNDAGSRDLTREASAVTSFSVAAAGESIPATMDTMQIITPTTSGETMSAGKRPAEDLSPVDLSTNPLTITSPGPRSAPGSWTQPGTSNAIPTLRAEVKRLRTRTQTLEATIRSMVAENSEMQESLRAVTSSGRRMRDAMDTALDAGQEGWSS